MEYPSFNSAQEAIEIFVRDNEIPEETHLDLIDQLIDELEVAARAIREDLDDDYDDDFDEEDD